MYRVACPKCGEDYEATRASWCRCVNTDRSLVCPSCKRCFCNASKTFRNQFWRDAPTELWEVRREVRQQAESSFPPVLKKPLVLVVDDDATIRLLSLELISRFGYGCIVASNAESAMRLTRRYHPDLVLTDLLMPGMDGRELSRSLRDDSQIPQPRIVCMTSVYRGEVYEGEATETFGVDRYLEKPVSMDDLRTVLAELLPPREESHANLSPSSSEISLEDLEDVDDDGLVLE